MDRASIDHVAAIVKEQMGKDVTGHDCWHADRVRRTALTIADIEGDVDRTVIELAALLHDLEDAKFGGSDERIPATIGTILTPLGVDQTTISHVCEAIRTVSFKGAKVDTTPTSNEGMIVQDADRLDALGAIGIARCFATGAAVKQVPIYDPSVAPTLHANQAEYSARNTGTSINHFHEKLLLLKDRLHTAEARRIAIHRHAFLEQFLAEFHAEWAGKR